MCADHARSSTVTVHVSEEINPYHICKEGFPLANTRICGIMAR